MQMVKLIAFAHLKIIIILSIYRKLFLSTNNRNILRHSVLHSNVACKLRIEGSQDDQVHVFETGYYVYGIHHNNYLHIIILCHFPYAAAKNTTFKEKRSKERRNWQCMFCNSFRYEIQVYLFCFGEENDNLTLSE
ncbi:hypothetical protein T08_16474 [Trichinella sp. T8]|nr:hypothetical protein T08_16474 [Trichinella sp. T8]